MIVVVVFLFTLMTQIPVVQSLEVVVPAQGGSYVDRDEIFPMDYKLLSNCPQFVIQNSEFHQDVTVQSWLDVHTKFDSLQLRIENSIFHGDLSIGSAVSGTNRKMDLSDKARVIISNTTIKKSLFVGSVKPNSLTSSTSVGFSLSRSSEILIHNCTVEEGIRLFTNAKTTVGADTSRVSFSATEDSNITISNVSVTAGNLVIFHDEGGENTRDKLNINVSDSSLSILDSNFSKGMKLFSSTLGAANSESSPLTFLRSKILIQGNSFYGIGAKSSAQLGGFSLGRVESANSVTDDPQLFVLMHDSSIDFVDNSIPEDDFVMAVGYCGITTGTNTIPIIVDLRFENTTFNIQRNVFHQNIAVSLALTHGQVRSTIHLLQGSTLNISDNSVEEKDIVVGQALPNHDDADVQSAVNVVDSSALMIENNTLAAKINTAGQILLGWSSGGRRGQATVNITAANSSMLVLDQNTALTMNVALAQTFNDGLKNSRVNFLLSNESSMVIRRNNITESAIRFSWAHASHDSSGPLRGNPEVLSHLKSNSQIVVEDNVLPTHMTFFYAHSFAQDGDAMIWSWIGDSSQIKVRNNTIGGALYFIYSRLTNGAGSPEYNVTVSKNSSISIYDNRIVDSVTVLGSGIWSSGATGSSRNTLRLTENSEFLVFNNSLESGRLMLGYATTENDYSQIHITVDYNSSISVDRNRLQNDMHVFSSASGLAGAAKPARIFVVNDEGEGNSILVTNNLITTVSFSTPRLLYFCYGQRRSACQVYHEGEDSVIMIANNSVTEFKMVSAEFDDMNAAPVAALRLVRKAAMIISNNTVFYTMWLSAITSRGSEGTAATIINVETSARLMIHGNNIRTGVLKVGAATFESGAQPGINAILMSLMYVQFGGLFSITDNTVRFILFITNQDDLGISQPVKVGLTVESNSTVEVQGNTCDGLLDIAKSLGRARNVGPEVSLVVTNGGRLLVRGNTLKSRLSLGFSQTSFGGVEAISLVSLSIQNKSEVAIENNTVTRGDLIIARSESNIPNLRSEVNITVELDSNLSISDNTVVEKSLKIGSVDNTSASKIHCTVSSSSRMVINSNSVLSDEMYVGFAFTHNTYQLPISSGEPELKIELSDATLQVANNFVNRSLWIIHAFTRALNSQPVSSLKLNFGSSCVIEENTAHENLMINTAIGPQINDAAVDGGTSSNDLKPEVGIFLYGTSAVLVRRNIAQTENLMFSSSSGQAFTMLFATGTSVSTAIQDNTILGGGALGVLRTKYTYSHLDSNIAGEMVVANNSVPLGTLSVGESLLNSTQKLIIADGAVRVRDNTVRELFFGYAEDSAKFELMTMFNNAVIEIDNNTADLQLTVFHAHKQLSSVSLSLTASDPGTEIFVTRNTVHTYNLRVGFADGDLLSYDSTSVTIVAPQSLLLNVSNNTITSPSYGVVLAQAKGGISTFTFKIQHRDSLVAVSGNTVAHLLLFHSLQDSSTLKAEFSGGGTFLVEGNHVKVRQSNNDRGTLWLGYTVSGGSTGAQTQIHWSDFSLILRDNIVEKHLSFFQTQDVDVQLTDVNILIERNTISNAFSFMPAYLTNPNRLYVRSLLRLLNNQFVSGSCKIALGNTTSAFWGSRKLDLEFSGNDLSTSTFAVVFTGSPNPFHEFTLVEKNIFRDSDFASVRITSEYAGVFVVTNTSNRTFQCNSVASATGSGLYRPLPLYLESMESGGLGFSDSTLDCTRTASVSGRTLEAATPSRPSRQSLTVMNENTFTLEKDPTPTQEQETPSRGNQVTSVFGRSSTREGVSRSQYDKLQRSISITQSATILALCDSSKTSIANSKDFFQQISEGTTQAENNRPLLQSRSSGSQNSSSDTLELTTRDERDSTVLEQQGFFFLEADIPMWVAALHEQQEEERDKEEQPSSLPPLQIVERETQNLIPFQSVPVLLVGKNSTSTTKRVQWKIPLSSDQDIGTQSSPFPLKVFKRLGGWINIRLPMEDLQCYKNHFFLDRFAVGPNISVFFHGIPPEPIISKEAQEVVGKITVATTATSSALGSVTGALYQARTGTLLSLGACTFFHDEPLDTMNSPTGYSFGTPHGAYYRGAVVGNLLLFWGLNLFFALICLLIFGLRRWCGVKAKTGDGSSFSDLKDAIATVHCPSVILIPTALGLQGTVAASLSIFIHSDDSVDIAIGVLGGVTCFVLLIFFIYPSLPNVFRLHLEARNAEGEAISSGEEKEKRKSTTTRLKRSKLACKAMLNKIMEGDQHWVDPKPETRWKRKYLFVFYDYNRPWFLPLELVVSFILGILDGLRISERPICLFQAITTLVVFIVMLILSLALRPSLSKFQQSFILVTYLLSAVGAAFLVAALIVDTTDGIGQVPIVAALIVAIVAVLKFIMDLWFAVLWAIELLYSLRSLGGGGDGDDDQLEEGNLQRNFLVTGLNEEDQRLLDRAIEEEHHRGDHEEPLLPEVEGDGDEGMMVDNEMEELLAIAAHEEHQNESPIATGRVLRRLSEMKSNAARDAVYAAISGIESQRTQGVGAGGGVEPFQSSSNQNPHHSKLLGSSNDDCSLNDDQLLVLDPVNSTTSKTSASAALKIPSTERTNYDKSSANNDDEEMEFLNSLL